MLRVLKEALTNLKHFFGLMRSNRFVARASLTLWGLLRIKSFANDYGVNKSRAFVWAPKKQGLTSFQDVKRSSLRE